MSTPVQIREWQLSGLPTDDVSTDSAILVTRGQRWPLMIDPQNQAKKWIKTIEASNSLEITRMNNINLLRSLEACIRVRTWWYILSFSTDSKRVFLGRKTPLD